MKRRASFSPIGASRLTYRSRGIHIVENTLPVDGLREEQSLHRQVNKLSEAQYEACTSHDYGAGEV